MTDSIFNAYEQVVIENHPADGIGSGTELKPTRAYRIQANRAFHTVARLWVETGKVEFFGMDDIFRKWTDEAKAVVKARLLECTEKTVYGHDYEV